MFCCAVGMGRETANTKDQETAFISKCGEEWTVCSASAGTGAVYR